MLGKLTSGVLENLLAKNNGLLIENIRVGCFSEIYNSILMWSHYADNHKGYCLEYNFKELENEQLLKNLIFPVIYRKEFYTEQFAIKDFKLINPYSLLYFLIIKSKEWKYEKEWRLIDLNYKLTNRNEPKVHMKPKAIYIGAKTPKDDKDKLIEAARLKGMKIYQMRMKENAFELYSELIN